MKMFVTLILPLLPLTAWAWGSFGHRASAELAWRHLNPTTQEMVSVLLAGEDFATASTWADAIRDNPEWQHTAPYHFTNISDGASYLQNLSAQSTGQQERGDVLMAVLKAESTLRDSHAYAEVDQDNWGYLKRSSPVLERKLSESGYHIACVLNTVFADISRVPASEVTLRRDIQSTLGQPFEHGIQLSPQTSAVLWNRKEIER